MVTAHNFNFRQFDPFFVGFDRVWDEAFRLQQSTGFPQKGYPPYNIVKKDDTCFSIEMAVAGFTEDDVEIVLKEDHLTISGKVASKDEDEIIHQGIAARNFERQFTLSESIEVTGCKLENGMLVISLEKFIPEEKRPKVIPINTDLSKSKKKFLTE